MRVTPLVTMAAILVAALFVPLVFVPEPVGGIGNIIIASITSNNNGTPRLPRERSVRVPRAVLSI